MKQLKSFMLDQPMTGLEKAVWWSEYVLRHNDTSHLKSVLAGKPFYDEFQLDVVGVLTVVAILVVKALQMALRAVCRRANVKRKVE